MRNSTWVKDKENRVTNLEYIIPLLNHGTFIGTLEKYKEAKAKDEIIDGMLIVITRKE